MAIIVVSAAACRVRGTLTIYKQFLTHLSQRIDGNHYYIFVHQSMPQPEIVGVDYLTIDVTSWSKRIVFDLYKAKTTLKKLGVRPSLIISLQNSGIWYSLDVPQIIYYQQAIPFYPNRWNLFRRDERSFALYKWLYPFFVRISYKKDKVSFIAQIPWIKDCIVRSFHIDPKNVYVLFPDVETIDKNAIRQIDYGYGNYHFFYPAMGAKYKEHLTLVRALEIIKNVNPKLCTEIQIHLTLYKDYSADLLKKMEEVGVSENFIFHGSIPHEELLGMLKSSQGLLFPSTMESFGLPLVEAASLGLPIVACGLDYARQVLGTYAGASYVKPYHFEDWAEEIMALCVAPRKVYPSFSVAEKSTWEAFFLLVQKLSNE